MKNPETILKFPQEISKWDWPDTTEIVDGYHSTATIPDASTKNLEFLADKYNELIRYLKQKEGE